MNSLTNPIKTRKAFRKWLEKNHDKEQECFVLCKMGQPKDNKTFYYVDSVEEALCFGWIDSTHRNVPNVGYVARFSPRRKNSNFSMLNIFRCKRLIKLGLMTDAGLKVIPSLNIDDFVIEDEIKQLLKKNKMLAKNFNSFPKLYQIIRIDNIQTQKRINPQNHQKVMDNFIKHTLEGKMYGQWNDWGRLLEK